MPRNKNRIGKKTITTTVIAQRFALSFCQQKRLALIGYEQKAADERRDCELQSVFAMRILIMNLETFPMTYPQ
jgi:hypothetical protein